MLEIAYRGVWRPLKRYCGAVKVVGLIKKDKFGFLLVASEIECGFCQWVKNKMLGHVCFVHWISVQYVTERCGFVVGWFNF